ncbi:unnamed protein product [Prunus armeniaca]
MVLLEDQVMAVPLMSAKVPKRSIEEYLIFFGIVPRGLLLSGKWYLEEHTLGSSLDTDSSRRSQKKKKQKDCTYSVNKISNSVDTLYPSVEPNSCSSGESDAWWKAWFASLPNASTTVKTLFETWDAGTILAEP